MKKKDEKLLAAGLAAPWMAYVVGIIINAFNEILIGLGILGFICALLIAIADAKDEIEEMITRIIKKEFWFFVGFIPMSLLMIKSGLI
jgi:hypothetical protein